MAIARANVAALFRSVYFCFNIIPERIIITIIKTKIQMDPAMLGSYCVGAVVFPPAFDVFLLP